MVWKRARAAVVKFIGCISIGAWNYGLYGNNFPIASDPTLQVTMTDCMVTNPCRGLEQL